MCHDVNLYNLYAALRQNSKCSNSVVRGYRLLNILYKKQPPTQGWKKGAQNSHLLELKLQKYLQVFKLISLTTLCHFSNKRIISMAHKNTCGELRICFYQEGCDFTLHFQYIYHIWYSRYSIPVYSRIKWKATFSKWLIHKVLWWVLHHSSTVTFKKQITCIARNYIIKPFINLQPLPYANNNHFVNNIHKMMLQSLSDLCIYEACDSVIFQWHLQITHLSLASHHNICIHWYL